MTGASLPPGVSLRLATTDDVEAGAALHVACWREAYGPYVGRERLEERLAGLARWERAWREQLEHGPARTLAVADGELVGFAVAGPNRDEEPQTAHELYALYARRRWWGSGVGQALWDAVAPQGPCSLWVLESNARAQAFYRRNGFAPDGSRAHYAGLDAWEIRMVRR